MATEIRLDQLNYPNAWVRESILRGDWPELLPHQWAILAGDPVPYMPWEIVLITKEEYEAQMAGAGVWYIDRYLQQSIPRSVRSKQTEPAHTTPTLINKLRASLSRLFSKK